MSGGPLAIVGAGGAACGGAERAGRDGEKGPTLEADVPVTVEEGSNVSSADRLRAAGSQRSLQHGSARRAARVERHGDDGAACRQRSWQQT